MTKLYHSAGSPNSRRVRFYLAERGIQVELVPVDLGSKEQFSENYAAINPRSVVPTLVLDDGTAVGEVPAIIRYFDEAFTDQPINGATPAQKAVVQMWERRIELEGFAAVMETVRNAAQGLAGRAISGPHGYEQISALVQRGHQRIADFYSDLEERLSTATYVAGETFSSADITAVVTIDFATKAVSLPIPEDYSATRHWYDQIAKRATFSA